MDATRFREAAHAAIEDIISYFQDLPNLRVTPSISPGYLRPQLPAKPPEEPEPWHQVIEDTSSKIKPGLTHWQSPNFMAFFPAMTSFPSMIAELYSAAFSAPAFNWVCSPACTELETVMLDWVAEILGLPEVFRSTAALEGGRDVGGGVIQGSASEAIVVSMTAAREKHVRRALEKAGLLQVDEEDGPERVRAREDLAASIRGRLVAIGSEQCHSSTHKAANILGMRYRTLRAAPENDFGLTADTLKGGLREIEDSGLIPCYITLSMGTTTTCAVDDFEGIAALKRETPDLWVHVDAAYAGSALVCEEMRKDLKAQWLGEFDSIDMNMHKWLLTNFDCSCMWVRSRYDLTTAMAINPAYLLNPSSIAGLVTDYRDWQIPLGRRFRSLKIWWVLRIYGVRKIREMIRRHVALGEVFAGLCRSDVGQAAGVEVVAGPAFGLTVFRIVEGGEEPVTSVPGRMRAGAREVGKEKSNELTKKVYERINAKGEIFITSSMLEGVFVIRVVSANELAEEKYVRGAFDKIVREVELVRREGDAVSGL